MKTNNCPVHEFVNYLKALSLVLFKKKDTDTIRFGIVN